MTTKLSVEYFRDLLAKTNFRIEELCSNWENKLKSYGRKEGEKDDGFCGQVRSVVGQGRLVMNSRGRLHQFKELVDNCEFSRGEKETTLLDLQGFWEMIYVQIQDVYSKFARLEAIEKGVYVDESQRGPSSAPTSVRFQRKTRLKKVSSSKELRAYKASKKRELKEDNFRKESELATSPTSRASKTFYGGFFDVTSPLRTSTSPPRHNKCHSSPGQRFLCVKSGEYLRQAVINGSSRKLPKSPFAIMKVSAVSKKDFNVADVKQRLFED